MIAVIFEVWPKDGHHQAYLDHATALRPYLDTLPGFQSIERFESLTTPGKLLSLSFFEDETAIAAWRALPDHRAAQTAGRSTHFADYRLRIAGVRRNYTMMDRRDVPDDSRAFHACPIHGRPA
ncbi:antibiotic biosynthesis monooxygenase [Rhodophyticola sp. CCM32]|uniref:antibiotic biosynthesis monooxygenase family protein n=1 Tax=Rhodophyticola sp. CCM32 TaxID=2916397 RepID=UPI00107FC57A|nr:antibiotic biosynthesis monooxygenase [Rhodophyticola sp. CCM32]QBY01618.1 antibiotic biosynthesis monooxygenase [Rhodophyticola sp. CCM32]